MENTRRDAASHSRQKAPKKDQYHSPWIMREVYGAPVWMIIAVGALLTGVVALAAIRP